MHDIDTLGTSRVVLPHDPTARELELEAAYRRTGSRKIAAAELGIKDSTAAVHLRNLNRRRGTPGRRVLGKVVIPQDYPGAA